MSTKASALALATVLIAGAVLLPLARGVSAQKKPPVPIYRVDPFWPKPLPNNWIIQGVPVMVTDRNDHIWVISRPRDINPDESGASTNPPRTDCCVAAPAVLEFDTAGNLLSSWGKPDYVDGWPAQGVARPGAGAEHAVLVDRDGNVWIDGNYRGDGIQKFSRDGKLLWDFGHREARPAAGQAPAARPMNNQNTDVIQMPVELFDLDEDARELYVVDQRRVTVYDMNTGAFKRGWGGHGLPLSEIDNNPEPPYDWKSAKTPPDVKNFVPALHCVHFAPDGTVYVCERGSDRIQAFTKQGKFVTSFFVHPSTPSRGMECGGPGSTTYGMCGTTYNLTFSHDANGQYVLVADGTNDKIWIHDRMTGELVGSIGSNGRMAGQFHWIDAIAMDSIGNLYTGEVDSGKRIQKFILTNGDGVKRPRPHE
jgi:hypothetical protein